MDILRLLRFYVRKHLLLQDIDLRFDRPGRLDTGLYALDFLVGVNGSGKSTLLRALVQIFYNLRNNQSNSFGFELEYLLGKNDTAQHVIIHCVIEEDKRVRQTMMVKSGDKIIYPESESIDWNYLPKNVIVYSTGSETEWEKLLSNTEEEFIVENTAFKDVIDNATQRAIIELPGSMASAPPELGPDEYPPFWLMRSKNLPIITLCGLLTHLSAKEGLLTDVLSALKIQSITGFSLRFRLHLQSSLSPLEEYVLLAPLATYGLQQGTDRLLYFDLESQPELIGKLIEKITSGFELYRILERISHNDANGTGQPTLQQVNIFMQRATQPVNEEEPAEGERTTIPNLFLLDWLSDGEQSFLGRMAMLAMLDTDDSLILLDEPEVHFNDYWKREVVNLLDTVMSSHTNHLLITTHSSILLSDVTDDQITVLFKNDDGVSQQRRPGIKTFGADPSEIMTVVFQTDIPSGRLSTESLTVAITDGSKETVEGYLQSVGPGMWRFRLKQRLGEIDASSD